MSSTIRVSIPTDSKGFVSQRCPSCRQCFRVRFGSGSNRPVAFCPYCGYHGKDCWWTGEQASYFKSVVSREAVEPMLDEFAQDLQKQFNRPGSPIRFTSTRRRKTQMTQNPRPLSEKKAAMSVMTFDCCGEKVKYTGAKRELHCIICGSLTSLV
jgi:hypothetical protein